MADSRATISLAETVAAVPRGRSLFQLTVKVSPDPAWANPGLLAKLRAWEPAPKAYPLLDRPFSPHRYWPELGELSFLIRPVGPGTRALASLKPGDPVRLTGPLGRGLADLAPDFAGRPFYLVAGGVGLAPMANFLAGQKAPAKLFYGERRGQDLIDREYLASFAPGFAAAAQDGQGYGERGLVTGLLGNALAQEKRDLFACGPPGLLAALAPLARASGVRYYAAAEAFMACGLGVCLSCARALADGTRIRLCQDGPVVDGLALDWGAP